MQWKQWLWKFSEKQIREECRFVFFDKNNEGKAILETIDIEDIRSYATVRVINCTILVFSCFSCELFKD